ncbi:MAG: SlyX family protein [Thiogranum sp.]
MTAIELSERLEVLEVRYAHQEAALEELTRTLLAQEQLIRSQRERLERLEQDVRALQGGVNTAVADEKPPHY